MTADAYAGAACRTLDPAEADRVFFGSPSRLDWSDAVAYCRRCPVLEQCRKDALAEEADLYLDRYSISSVRGGLTPDERIQRLRFEAASCP